ncbi:MAG: hypothetical protein ACRCV9_03680 [Burkholderiaceae bacterium]
MQAASQTTVQVEVQTAETAANPAKVELSMLQLSLVGGGAGGAALLM